MDLICRTCLRELTDFSSEYLKISQVIEEEDLQRIGETMEIDKMLSFCTGIRLADLDLHPTKKVCLNCVKKIQDFFRFREICIKSHYYLMGYTKTNQEEDNVEVKVEEISDLDEVLSELPETDTDIEEYLISDTAENKNRMTPEVNVSLEDDIKEECPVEYLDVSTENLTFQDSETVKLPEIVKVSSSKQPLEIVAGVCPHCGKTYSTAGGLAKHIQTQHSKTRTKCKLCNFTTTDYITSHMKRVHPATRDFICPFPDCGRTYKSSDNLKSHQDSHAPPRYECKTCKRKFHRKTKYNRHVKIHDLDTYVSCDLCGRKFARKGTLDMHRRTHTKEYEFTCELCGKQFIQKQAWRSHMKRHHKEVICVEN